jgi:hypothetical protein
VASDEMEELTAAEERRAAEEALIAERNAAQREADRQDATGGEQPLVLPPEGYAAPADPPTDRPSHRQG